MYFLFFFLLLSPFHSLLGYDIRIKVNGLHDTTVILGHYLNKSMYPDDTIMLNSKGMGQFGGKQSFA